MAMSYVLILWWNAKLWLGRLLMMAERNPSEPLKDSSAKSTGGVPMSEPVWVKILAEYSSPYDKTIEESAFHQFLDLAPEFETSQALLEMYHGLENLTVHVWHNDPPTKRVVETHCGGLNVH